MNLQKTGRSVEHASGEENRIHSVKRHQIIRRQTGSLLSSGLNKITLNICVLSFILTKWYQLSTKKTDLRDEN